MFIRLRVLIIVLAVITISCVIKQGQSLECYVCQNQEDNKSKCAETVKICDLAQEQCLTEVRWGSTPHWALTGQKQHFISKRCATKQECQEAIADKYKKCDRIGYNDWNCTTCCGGDKCNYYVTLTGHSIKPLSPIVILSGVAMAFMLYCLEQMSIYIG